VSWRLLDTSPARAVGVRPAADVADVVGPCSYLHAGPALDPAELVGPMRGALLGALVFEGEAADLKHAEEIVQAREVALSPCHDSGGVGAMAGIVTPHMPVVVVEGEDEDEVVAFASLNEGLGSALRFGSTSPKVLRRLEWMRDVLGVVLDRALGHMGGIDLIALQAEGLRRGDECHNRNVATTAALIAQLAPSIVRTASTHDAADVIEFLAANPHSFLSFSMAAGKSVADAAHRGSARGLVTGIAANGVRIGVRVSGCSRWFEERAPLGVPRFFEGFSAQDACPLMGDSFITETIGLGAFAGTAAPAIAAFVGGTSAQARQTVAEMRRICRGESSRFLIPAEEFRGTPLGIDVNLVRSAGIAPVVNNGVAHRLPGKGQIGAGLTRLPLEPFVAAADALDAVDS
jgi:hypothetical protein